MLGHDYGFKRIMSSYYFQDTDQVFNHKNYYFYDHFEFSKTKMRVRVCRVHQGEPLRHTQISAATDGLVSTG